jgi:hypothetical protein
LSIVEWTESPAESQDIRHKDRITCIAKTGILREIILRSAAVFINPPWVKFFACDANIPILFSSARRIRKISGS